MVFAFAKTALFAAAFTWGKATFAWFETTAAFAARALSAPTGGEYMAGLTSTMRREA